MRGGASVCAASLALALMCMANVAHAQDAPPPTGAPPPDEAAAVTAPTAPTAAPKIDKPASGTAITLSSGGQLATGNSRLLAMTANGTFDVRRGSNGFGSALIANYGQGAAAGQPVQETAENFQGKLRYDRYVSDRTSLFFLTTGRHDRFQGLDFRLNLDPGVKYILSYDASYAFWLEGGYDFQYDVRRDAALGVLDASGMPVLDANGNPELLSKTAADHSTRLFAGYRHAFNSEVTLSTGLEYLQSFIDATRYRINGDALFAAKVGGGLAVGFGFSARYDHDPLPGKETLDTSTTVSLIYSFSDAQPAAPKCATYGTTRAF